MAGRWTGKVRTFLERIGAWRDPYEETMLLPVLMVLVFFHLAEAGKITGATAAVALIVISTVTGMWLGAMLGLKGSFRTLLRGFSVGMLLSALIAATTNIAVVKPDILSLTSSLVQITMRCMWSGHMVTGFAREIILQSEEDRRRGALRREWLLAKLQWLLNTPMFEIVAPVHRLVWPSVGRLMYSAASRVFGWFWVRLTDSFNKFMNVVLLTIAIALITNLASLIFGPHTAETLVQLLGKLYH